MRPVFLKFYGNHTIDFTACPRDTLTRNITLEMRNLEIPGFDDIILSEYDRLKAEDPPEYLAEFASIDTWTPLSFPESPNFPAEIHNIVLMGPMGLCIWFTPHHLEFSSAIRDRAGWYAPRNRETVMAWRTYFHAIITHFGGDKAVYISEAQAEKHYRITRNNPGAFNDLIAALISKYGLAKKSLFDFTNGKYPPCYIDDFSDLQAGSS